MQTINLSRMSRLIVAIGLIGLTGWFYHAATAAPSPNNALWKPSRHISINSQNGAFNPIIKQAPNGVLTIMYNHMSNSGITNPYYTQSINGGVSWNTPLPVRTSSTALSQVQFEIDANSVGHAIWREYDNSDPENIRNRLIHSRQNQWGSSATTIVDTNQYLIDPAIAIAADGTIHVAWSQGEELHELNVYHASSQNGGQSWTVSPALGDATQASSVPTIAVTQNGNVHVAWEGRVFDPAIPGFVRAINYKKRVGAAWDAQPTILSAGLNSNARRPSFLAEGNNIHLAFTRQASNEEQYPYYRMYNGFSWSSFVDASNGRSVNVNAQSPFFLLTTMDTCNGNLYLYYHGAIAAGVPEQILGSNKKSGWNQRDIVTESAQRSVNPSMICIHGELHLVFEQIVVANVNHQVYHMIGFGNSVYLPIILR